jgi:hypothetical protein
VAVAACDGSTGTVVVVVVVVVLVVVVVGGTVVFDVVGDDNENVREELALR